MKKTTIIVSTSAILLIGAIVLTLAANKKTIDSRKEASVTQADIAVSTALVENKQTNLELQLVGTAQACKEVNVASESTGKIVQVNFKMGDHVVKGQVLAKIDDTYKRLAYESAKLTYDKNKDDYERNINLHKGNAISDTQLRDIKMAFDNAKNQLENAKKQLADTRITAPFSGYITSQSAELGAYVNAGNPIAYMADISNLKVTLDVSETNAYELKKGQVVSITTDVQPDLEFSGRISNISAKASSSHTYPVEIMIVNNGKEKLKAGTYVNVDIQLGKTGNSLIISRSAIVSSVKDPSVYVVRKGKVYLTKITTGHNYESTLEVINGLNAGDRIVTSGQINLTDGAKVSLIN
jgi:RND family efflux transporter MFP subunit